MKKMLFAMMLAPLFSFGASSTPEGFTDDFDAAVKSAAASGKFVYACFSGSDWCGWCKKLDKEVFAKPEFIKAVGENYELVFIDSPSDQSVLSEHAKKANPDLVKKYGIKGFPSAIVFDNKGEEVTRTGYRDGGAEAYAAFLNDVKARAPEIREHDQLFATHIKPLIERHRGLMMQLNAKCRDFQRAEMEKGATLEAAREASKVCIKEFLPKLEELLKAIEDLKVPAAIEPDRVRMFNDFSNWINLIKGAE